jgi:diguanylate cyclase (GGDEF)-like protein
MTQIAQIFLAGAAATACFALAGLVIPRIRLEASRRVTLLFRGGAIAFFAASGLAQLGSASAAFADPAAVEVGTIGLQLLQAGAGWLVIAIVLGRFELSAVPRDVRRDVRLEELSRLALEDPLTGSPNRRAFELAAAAAIAARDAEGTPFAVLVIDIDDFKRVNDAAGHAAGDTVLREVLALLTAMLRPEDTLARLGGDELGAVLRGADRVAAVRVGERMRRGLSEMAIGPFGRITISIGVAAYPVDGASIGALERAADRALYAAKAAGKDRCLIADVALADVPPPGRELRAEG